jgi:hypothetical protein
MSQAGYHFYPVKEVAARTLTEDRKLRDLLSGQKRNARSSIEFTDYSVKQPWSSSWKTNCRQRIRACKGMIGIITQNTPQADGQLWELQCAIEEDIPLMLIHGHSDATEKLTRLPKVIQGLRINLWTEDNVVGFLNKLAHN